MDTVCDVRPLRHEEDPVAADEPRARELARVERPQTCTHQKHLQVEGEKRLSEMGTPQRDCEARATSLLVRRITQLEHKHDNAVRRAGEETREARTHVPAMTRSRLDLPTPDPPVMSRLWPLVTSKFRSATTAKR